MTKQPTPAGPIQPVPMPPRRRVGTTLRLGQMMVSAVAGNEYLAGDR